MNKIELFENRQIRSIWNEETSEWYFSVVDVIGVLTEQTSASSASTYWAVLKKRLATEGANELLTNCKQLKMRATDGKNYLTDVADTEQFFRLIQSIPSPKAEPFKRWISEASATEISKTKNPKGFNQSQSIALERAKVAKKARKDIEQRTGKSAISSLNAKELPGRIENNTMLNEQGGKNE